MDRLDESWYAEKAIEEAVRYDHLEMVQLLREYDCPWTPNTYECAASVPNSKTIAYLDEWNCPRNGNSITAALYRGDITLAEQLRRSGCPLTEEMEECVRQEFDSDAHMNEDTYATLRKLIQSGCLEAVIWICENHAYDMEVDNVFDELEIGALFGTIMTYAMMEMVHYLENYFGFFEELDAVHYIRIDIDRATIERITWLCSRFDPDFVSIECTRDRDDLRAVADVFLEHGHSLEGLFPAVVSAGNMCMLEILVDHYECPNIVDYELLIEHERWDMLKYVASKKTLPTHLLEKAIKKSVPTEYLSWLIENGCTWQEREYEIAVVNEDVRILDWLYENECPISNMCISYIRNTKYTDWLEEKGLDKPKKHDHWFYFLPALNLPERAESIVSRGDTNEMERMQEELKVDWHTDKTLRIAIEAGQPNIVWWLNGQSTTRTKKLKDDYSYCRTASRRRRYDVLCALIECGFACGVGTLRAIIENDDFVPMKWFCRKRPYFIRKSTAINLCIATGNKTAEEWLRRQ
jgi:hypothetical protein